MVDYRFVLAAVLPLLSCEQGSTVGAPPTAATDGHSAAREAVTKPRIVAVADLAKLLKSGGATAVDANGPDVRVELGVVPDAALLSDPPRIPRDLPADKTKPLVFYCYNRW